MTEYWTARQCHITRVVIHIGYPKTGTTVIQHGLLLNRRRLRNRGVDVPSAGMAGASHHNLAWEIMQDRRMERGFGDIASLRGELRRTKCRTAVLSCEALHRLNPQEIERLAARLEDFPVQIVVYLRRQAELLQSIWSQDIKMGIVVESFDEWFAQLFSTRSAQQRYARLLERLDYRSTLEPWSACFGRENILVRPYERRSLDPDIFRDFLRTIGLHHLDWTGPVNTENRAPSLRTLETIRAALRSLDPETPERIRRSAYRDRPRVFSEIIRRMENRGWNTSKLHLIDREQYEFLESRYRASNDDVARTFLGRETLFTDPPCYTDHPQKSISSVELAESLAALGPDIRRKLKRAEKDIGYVPSRYRYLRSLLFRHADLLGARPLAFALKRALIGLPARLRL